ncbi:transcriptional Coactivator p15-domain-containing protein [Gamsiella multidivaricata]|uniref:transcriptional Coactivator p15-domain-containing protein n=1 Tax=Gamsiella multidivaricata TaxID=101098 RepID=UPI00222055C9|nr:transcriptional Coactivator p15-domain-containing protein [Gamsiella multidivaricata]KAG0354693.1 hypothetical protein BGZ54_001521 [Gamsiella multidivaricata]KAI7830741.1 transcriptional Coactivator p15-domain-containing protein [Gamsiella multidivaricata]
MANSNNKRSFVVSDSDDGNDSDADFTPKNGKANPSAYEIIDDGESEAEEPKIATEMEGSVQKKVKVQKTSAAKQNSEGETFFELGPKKRLTVRSWQKNTLIDFREYYTDKGGESKPGKKGISLTTEQFQYILDHASEINRAIKSIQS